MRRVPPPEFDVGGDIVDEDKTGRVVRSGDDFETLFVSRTRQYKVGPKLDEDCNMGPMIAEGEAKRIEKLPKLKNIPFLPNVPRELAFR